MLDNVVSPQDAGWRERVRAEIEEQQGSSDAAALAEAAREAREENERQQFMTALRQQREAEELRLKAMQVRAACNTSCCICGDCETVLSHSVLE